MRKLSSKPSAILRRAATIIKRGWCQGKSACDEEGREIPDLGPGATRFCVLGAITKASGIENAARSYANAALRSVIREDRIAIWNDTSGRKKSEVVEALLKAARKSEREERQL